MNETRLMLLVAAAVFVIWTAASYRSFARLCSKCTETFQELDASLKKRYDLIPKLVEIIRLHAPQESAALEAVSGAQSLAVHAVSPEQKILLDNALSDALKSLLMQVMSNPGLKTSGDFRRLRHRLSRVEGEISDARLRYNEAVNLYNEKTDIFPSMLFADLFGFYKKPLYELAAKKWEGVRKA